MKRGGRERGKGKEGWKKGMWDCRDLGTVAASLVARQINTHLLFSQHATGSSGKEECVQCAV